MVGQSFDMLGQPIWVRAFDSPDDLCVQSLAAILEQRAIGDVVGQRVFKGEGELRQRFGLVQQLSRFQVTEPAMKHRRALARDRLKEVEGEILSYDRRGLENPLLLRRHA